MSQPFRNMFRLRSTFILLAFTALLSNVIAKQTRIEHSQIVRQVFPRGCNLNVCFALDGSARVSKTDFNNFRTFVRIVVRRLSYHNRIQVAGVQYGFLSHPISPLTKDTEGFRELLRETIFEGAEFTRVSGGMVYCFGQLRSPPDLLPRARIVILGSGEAELGIDPETVAELFREEGGSIFGIGVDSTSRDLLAEFLGTSRSVFTLGSSRESILRLVDRFIPALCRG